MRLPPKTKNKDLRPIIQKERGGCALAGIATITGLTYDKVEARANSLGIYTSDDKLYSETDYVRRLLKEYGIKAAPDEIAFRSWEALPELALLAVKYHMEDGRHLWHWVVFSSVNGSPVVMDSAAYLKNNIRRDFHRIKPKWYIEILNRK